CQYMLEMDPEFVTAHRVLAASLLQAGRGDEAVAQLELALTFDPSHPVLLSWLAHVKAVLGCRSQAQALIARPRSFERTRYLPSFHRGGAPLRAAPPRRAIPRARGPDQDPALESWSVRTFVGRVLLCGPAVKPL